MEECLVYLCQFHREQAWDRWLSNKDNGASNFKEEIKSMLRKIANSATEEDFLAHVDEMKESSVYRNCQTLSRWLEKKWLPNFCRWVFAYRKDLVNVRLTTTNGLERKHQDLKKNYLAQYGDGTLVTLVSTLIDRFLVESYDEYLQYNVKSLEVYRSYNNIVPEYLKNKPKKLIEHCLSRLPPQSNEIPSENIVLDNHQPGTYQVKSMDSDMLYNVCLTDDGPSCQCMDWGKHHLPCKHMLAVFNTIADWDWNQLPTAYRDCPHLNLDPVVVAASIDQSDSMHCPIETTNENEEERIFIEPVLPTSNSNSGVSESNCFGASITKCTHLLKDIQNYLYRLDNHQHFDEVEKELTSIATKMKDMVPHEEGLPPRIIRSKPKSGPKRSMKDHLPLRKNRKKNLKLKGRKSKRIVVENIIVDGTYDAPTIDDDEDNPAIDGLSSNEQNNGVKIQALKGTKRRKNLQSKKASRKKTCVGLTLEKESTYETTGTRNKTISENSSTQKVQQFQRTVESQNMSINVIGYQINQQSFTDLDSMLPDEVMNAYISLKCRECKAKRVKFLGCEIMTAIFSGVISSNDPYPVHSFLSEIDLDEFDILVGALNEGGVHWSLMCIFPVLSELLYINPLGETKKVREQYLQQWIGFINERYNRGIGDEPKGNWTILTKKHRKQFDSNSCGIFVLKFAELVLDGNESLMFDSSKNRLKSMRLEIGQYLVESSDNMVEIATTQEVFEVDEVNETHDDQEKTVESERTDKHENEPIKKQGMIEESEKNDGSVRSIDDDDGELSVSEHDQCVSDYNQFKDTLYSMINCEKKECDLKSHLRHHLFMENPLRFYNQHKAIHCFGTDVLKQTVIEGLSMIISKDTSMVGCDRGRPYSNRHLTLKECKNSKLLEIFRVFGQLLNTYQIGVLVKELIVLINMRESGLSYEEVDDKCRSTEINVQEMNRKSRLARRK